jgi:hypothetical protein
MVDSLLLPLGGPVFWLKYALESGNAIQQGTRARLRSCSGRAGPTRQVIVVNNATIAHAVKESRPTIPT